jgi:hypothetical protein
VTSDVPQLFAELRTQNFYGSIELKLEAGRIVLIKKSETFKPTEPTLTTKQSEPRNGKPYTTNSR